MKLTTFAVLLFFAPYLFGCKKNSSVPAPAQAISGTYKASTYQGLGNFIHYPINGQTISLKIEAVAKDTVNVQITSASNGFYSPGGPAL